MAYSTSFKTGNLPNMDALRDIQRSRTPRGYAQTQDVYRSGAKPAENLGQGSKGSFFQRFMQQIADTPYMQSGYGGQPSGAPPAFQIPPQFRNQVSSAEDAVIKSNPTAGVATQQSGPSIFDAINRQMPFPTPYPGPQMSPLNQEGDPGFMGPPAFLNESESPVGVSGIIPQGSPPPSGAHAKRHRFGPPGPTGTDFGMGMHRQLASGLMNQFMNAPQNLADQLNASFDRSADRNLTLNNQRLQELAIRMRQGTNRRLIDAIREMLGGGGDSGGPIPPGAIESANAALRNVRPDMGRPDLTQLMANNIRLRAPDLERTLTPANRSLGLAMNRQRLANASPLFGLMQ